uniref:Uncharacterized protein n=1 Tax=Tetranychus urticae TaxID=32264 RepID=T1K7N3_TETUR
MIDLNNKVALITGSSDEIGAINVRSAVRLTKLAAPHLKKTNGSIVNVSSSYCMSKAALDMFTKCMAVKLAPHVRVNSVNSNKLHPKST